MNIIAVFLLLPLVLQQLLLLLLQLQMLVQNCYFYPDHYHPYPYLINKALIYIFRYKWFDRYMQNISNNLSESETPKRSLDAVPGDKWSSIFISHFPFLFLCFRPRWYGRSEQRLLLTVSLWCRLCFHPFPRVNLRPNLHVDIANWNRLFPMHILVQKRKKREYSG